MSEIDKKKMTLEEKIIKAKELGLKFSLIPAGCGMPTSAADTMNVMVTWSNEEFEKALDAAMERFTASSFLSLLKKYELI